MEEMERQPTQGETRDVQVDEQLLERVWARVMQGHEDSGNPARLMPPEGQTQPIGWPMEEERVGQKYPESRQRTGERQAVGSGKGAEACIQLLQRMIDGEQEDGRIYRALACKATGGSMARRLSRLAQQEQVHAKRLGAAYFILAGRPYSWREQGKSRPVVELLSGLREQLLQKQKESRAYRQAAEVQDPHLHRLFLELAEQEEEQAGVLRRILEQM